MYAQLLKGNVIWNKHDNNAKTALSMSGSPPSTFSLHPQPTIHKKGLGELLLFKEALSEYYWFLVLISHCVRKDKDAQKSIETYPSSFISYMQTRI